MNDASSTSLFGDNTPSTTPITRESMREAINLVKGPPGPPQKPVDTGDRLQVFIHTHDEHEYAWCLFP